MRSSEEVPDPRKSNTSVDQALMVVRLLASQSVVQSKDVCDLLGVRDPAARRVLAVLERHDFASYDESTDVYRSRAGSWSVQPSAVAEVDRLRKKARPLLDRLARETGETVHLGVLDGVGVRFVDVIESHHPLRVSGRVGR